MWEGVLRVSLIRGARGDCPMRTARYERACVMEWCPREAAKDQILVVEHGADAASDLRGLLADDCPAADVYATATPEGAREALRKNPFTVVVLGEGLEHQQALHLVHECKLQDGDPAVLVVTPAVDARHFTDLYSSGAHKCIQKSGSWKEELGPAVRQLVRMKRLEAENQRLLARITEANILLEEKNRRLDEFSATVAHDIRGPLGGISMKIEFLLDLYRGKIDQRFDSLMDRALQSTDRLTRIVQAMYDFAKLGSRAAKMEIVPLDRLVAEVAGDLNFDPGLDIKLGIADLPQVWGNPELLRRIFINLINNAVKYNDKREIVINIGVAGVQEKGLARFADIFVEDNGPGIPLDEQRDLFAMFTRGSTSRPDDGGSGLGLAVVKRIAELHYGSVRVESTPGRGSRFIVSLPLEQIDFIK